MFLRTTYDNKGSIPIIIDEKYTLNKVHCKDVRFGDG